MTIAELGTIGEFVGSIVVIVTLIYAAVQIRSTRLVLNAQVVSDRMAQAIDVSGHFFNSPYLPNLLTRAFSGKQAISLEDEARLRHYIHMHFCLVEGHYLHHRLGVIDTEAWRSHLYSLSRDSVFDNSVARSYWVHSRTLYDPGFAALVDAVFVAEPTVHVGVEETVQFRAADAG